jgi:hypothetical protein
MTCLKFEQTFSHAPVARSSRSGHQRNAGLEFRPKVRIKTGRDKFPPLCHLEQKPAANRAGFSPCSSVLHFVLRLSVEGEGFTLPLPDLPGERLQHSSGSTEFLVQLLQREFNHRGATVGAGVRFIGGKELFHQALHLPHVKPLPCFDGAVAGK